ncbi:MAG: hypothetical protein PVJ09_04980 [Candidatus Woesebacteria bacterium]
MTKIKNKNQLFLLILILLLGSFLRLYRITSLPPSLYWEEVALGYDAYSIANTLKDHHGNFLPLVAFESFGDWKPSLYFYSIVPFVKTLGLTKLAVRLPSAISGILIILALYQLSKLFAVSILLKEKKRNRFALISAALLAISPWAIQFSRAAWEANLATCLSLWGVVFALQFLLKVKNKKLTERFKFNEAKSLYASLILLILSTYTYHSLRVIIPLYALVLSTFYLKLRIKNFKLQNLFKVLRTDKKILLFASSMALLLFSPILLSLEKPELKHRFQETSIFSDISIIKESNLRKEKENNSLLSRVFYHRYLLFSREIAKNYLSHFDFDFLFLSGDINPRHSIQIIGQLYYLDLLFLFIGIYYLFKRWNKFNFLILSWLFISIIPASLTRTTPHALRILPSMPIFILIIALGIYFFLEISKNLIKNYPIFKNKTKIFFPFLYLSLSLIYFLQLFYFWHHYSRVYPKLYDQEWQYGYEELILSLKQLQTENPDLPIYVSRAYGRPAMYYWFYSKTDPKEVQIANETVKKDQGEFLEFNKIKFINSLDEIIDQKSILALPVKQNKELMETTQNYELYKEIKNLKDQVIWHIMITN